MPAEEQSASRGRYLLVPRTLVFARRGDSYLLIKGGADKRLWPGLYNGVGGHVEQGEAVLEAAQREFLEETGLEANLRLCGTVVVDAGEVGICLYVFTGEVTGGALRASLEGEPEWISIHNIDAIRAVNDLAPMLTQIHSMKVSDAPFSGRSFYDQEGELQITFRG